MLFAAFVQTLMDDAEALAALARVVGAHAASMAQTTEPPYSPSSRARRALASVRAGRASLTTTMSNPRESAGIRVRVMAFTGAFQAAGVSDRSRFGSLQKVALDGRAGQGGRFFDVNAL